MPSSYNPPGTGGGEVGLSVWEWDAGGGDPDPGCFTTNTNNPQTTTQIKVAELNATGDGYGTLFGLLPLLSIVYLVSTTTGKVAGFQLTAVDGGTWTVASYGTSATTWDGDYQFSYSSNSSNIQCAGTVGDGALAAWDGAGAAGAFKNLKSAAVNIDQLVLKTGDSAPNIAAIDAAGNVKDSTVPVAAVTAPGLVNGIIKGSGAGEVSAATPGTDYLAPNPAADGTYTGVSSITILNGLVTAITEA